MQDLMQMREDVQDALNTELKTLKTSGIAFAENEAAYRKALRVAILNERTKGTSVSLISDICRGMNEIAGLKCIRDSSEAVYKASQEAINVYKLRIKTLNEDINREWNSGGTSEY